MKKHVISVLFTIILLFTLKNTCNAASATISCDANATVGKEITISASVTGVMWNLELKVNGETIAKNNELENVESNKTVTFSGKYTPKSEGKLTVTLAGTVTEFSDGSTIREFGPKSITVTPVVEPPKEPDTPPVTTTPEPETPPVATTKSSEARLSNLGIKPNDFSGFKKDKYEYSTTVPNEVTEVEVYANIIKDSNATIEGTGKVSLKEGDNKVSVKVTAEDGKTTKTYNLTIKRKTAAEEEAENGEARLKLLGIKPEQYDFTGFDSEKTEYSVEVPNDVEEIEVYATPMNSKAQITGTGMIDLKEGVNELLIEVIAANGEKKSYTLKVTREEADETTGITEEKLGLSTLSIQGLKLSPSFEVDIYEYTATITDVMVGNSLNITAKANNQDAEVEIIGNENLQDGENVITILVKNEETEENATYQITVNKKVEVEIVEKTSWLKPSTWGKEEKIKILIIIVLIILIISAIILKIKISKEGNKPVAKDLPGAEELDKAIAEHQELSEEVNSEVNLEKEEVRQNYIEEIAMNRFDSDDFGEKPKRKGRHF